MRLQMCVVCGRATTYAYAHAIDNYEFFIYPCFVEWAERQHSVNPLPFERPR